MYATFVAFATSVFVFALAHKSGDPRTVLLTTYTSQEQYDAWGKRWGLDKPLVVQYGIWLGNALKGDFGESLRELRPVRKVILERIPATLQLAAGSFLFALVVGISVGNFGRREKG